MPVKQKPDGSIIQYLYGLREASRFYKFEKLKTQDLTIEEELIQLRLIEGMVDISHKYEILEKLEQNNWPLTAGVEVIQYLELVIKYNSTEENVETQY